MDKAQGVKEHKLERVIIYVIKKALRFIQGDEEIEQDFSIQYEEDIWWLVAFQTLKEFHDTLKWFFERT